MDRRQLVGALKEVAVLLQLNGANPFKTRAYENAARTLEGLGEDPVQVIREGRHGAIKGVGKGIAEQLTELVTKGTLSARDELRAEVPSGLLEWLKIPGFGPKKVRKVHEALGITELGELEYACNENRLSALKGFGAKTEQKVLAGIAHVRRNRDRFRIPVGELEAETLLGLLRTLPGVVAADVTGSLRRRRETVKDVDLVVATDDPQIVHDSFVRAPGTGEIVSHGETKSTVRRESGIQVDLRTVAPASYPYLLHHMTGSAAHNTAMRARARERGLKLNEYGLFDESGASRPATAEADVFAALDLAWIPPELREDLGEIAAAEADDLPTLVETSEVRGILHVHTTWSDGAHTLRQMAEACRDAGYAYLGICDHSVSAFYARGLEPKRVREQHAEIDALNEELSPFRILKGIELDILRDGSVDYGDLPAERAVLPLFDFTVASVHSTLSMDLKSATERILKAIRNPYVDIIGHPTGRLLLDRAGYPLDMERVLAAAAEEGVAMELNASPHRLDLDWRECRRARELGVSVAINPDAHRIGGLSDVRYGVGAARKGWLTARDVLNCLPLDELLARFAERRRG